MTKKKELLEVARRDFPSYYSRATPRDTALMDTLVLIAALVLRIKATRMTEDDGSASQDLEDTSHAAQRAFADLRDKVRACPILASLPVVERWKIESAILERAL